VWPDRCPTEGRLINTASRFVCLVNIIDGHVNSTLGPETHNGADKTGMGAMTRTNSGTGPFAFSLRSLKSSLARFWAIDANMSDVKAAQIVTIFGTFWMVVVGLQMLNETTLGRGSTGAAAVAAPSP
jgi:hypothetical protein